MTDSVGSTNIARPPTPNASTAIRLRRGPTSKPSRMSSAATVNAVAPKRNFRW